MLNTYELSQNGLTATAVYPYFQDANYIGTEIPAGTMNILGVNFATSKIGNNYPPFQYYIVPRSSSDFVTSAINEYELNGVAVYPNPARDYVTFGTSELVESVALYDVTGKCVLSTEISNNRISVAGLTDGVYFARLYREGKQVGVAKIVKK